MTSKGTQRKGHEQCKQPDGADGAELAPSPAPGQPRQQERCEERHGAQEWDGRIKAAYRHALAEHELDQCGGYLADEAGLVDSCPPGLIEYERQQCAATPHRERSEV